MTCVLVADDSASARRHVREALTAAGLANEVLEATNGLEAFRRLVDGPVDLVVSDLEMPGADATKLLGLRAAHAAARRIPVIVLTAVADPESTARLLGLGASDYVTKPFHPSELVARARLHLRLMRQEAELRAANERLEQLALTDPLTGLANRRAFEDALARELDRWRRYRSRLSLVSVDVDHFKRVNDQHGHSAGDSALRAVAALLRLGTRATDTVFRVGGEELAILLPETGLREAADVAERLRASIASHEIALREGASLRCTASFGVAGLELLDAVTGDALVEAADRAVYAAKRGGRDRVVVSAARRTLETTAPPPAA
ncbi:MAG: diguanylate cyclase [Polyangiaceae bacterium]|nr:diguanylate cyclase [Polyangiaceae bacterium]